MRSAGLVTRDAHGPLSPLRERVGVRGEGLCKCNGASTAKEMAVLRRNLKEWTDTNHLHEGHSQP
jgi:hypothetical protein